MTPDDDLAVSVMARWNDWQSAHARLRELDDVHWHQPTGAPHSMIHAYLSCAGLVSGELSHRCDPASAPHRVRVCVLRSRNIPAVYAQLARQADEGRDASCRPSSARSALAAPTHGWSTW